jgi:oligopeptide/dipeptide ABC transporter ATP-binding protein
VAKDTSPEPLLALRGLSVGFARRGQLTRVVDDVHWSVRRSESVVVLGESGSGKSVTALAIAGLLPPSARVTGSATFEGSELIGARPRAWRDFRTHSLGMVFQDPLTALNPTRRVGDQIAELYRVHRGAGRRQAAAAAAKQLERVHLSEPDVARRYPHQLSGGMRQRVVIAMAIALDPPLMLADEPTTALDVSVQASILRTIRELQQNLETALVLITHDIGVASAMADTVVVMYAGRVVERGPTEQILRRPSHPYTKALLAATPDPGVSKGALRPIAGAPPDFNALPSGCRFHPRCGYARARCITEEPPLREVDAAQSACHFAELVSADSETSNGMGVSSK